MKTFEGVESVQLARLRLSKWMILLLSSLCTDGEFVHRFLRSKKTFMRLLLKDVCIQQLLDCVIERAASSV